MVVPEGVDCMTDGIRRVESFVFQRWTDCVYTLAVLANHKRELKSMNIHDMTCCSFDFFPSFCFDQ